MFILAGMIVGFTAYPSMVDDIKDLVTQYVMVSLLLHSCLISLVCAYSLCSTTAAAACQSKGAHFL